jgi:Holliday junction resolvasome RuvABC endonuclease subunit
MPGYDAHMSGVLVADRLPGLDEIPEVTAPVWGIDPSTKRVSVGLVLPGHQIRVHTLSMPTGHFARRLAHGHAALCDWLPRLINHYGAPASILIEEPFGGVGQNQVHPSSNRSLGVLLAALSWALPHTDLDLIGPGTWKARSVGHGRASKDDVMSWAIAACGYAGSLQDEADALGIAWAAALSASAAPPRP